MRLSSIGYAAVLSATLASPTVRAASVAILTGNWYTPNLKNELIAKGNTVTEVSTYTAATLAPYDAVVMYGNLSLNDFTAMTTYVNGGGTLVETPWGWNNYSLPAALEVVSHGGTTAYSQSSPGITVLSAGDPLLDGVSLPLAAGATTIGRTTGNSFVSGVTQVANWADGTAMIGHRSQGAGQVIAINLHVITRDTAYTVIDQPWAAQLLDNAVNFEGGAAVPAPAAATGGAVLLVGAAALRRRQQPVA